MRRTYDSDSYLKETVRDQIKFADPRRTIILSSLFGSVENAIPVNNTKPVYYDNYSLYESGKITTDFSGSTENYMTCSADHEDRLRVYDIVRVGESENYWQVSTINTSTHVVTFTTAGGTPIDGTAADVASGSSFYRVGGAWREGQALPGTELIRNEVERTGYLQEIFQEFRISDTQNKGEKKYGGTELENMIVKGTTAWLKELDRLLIEGVENTTGTSSRPQAFAGLWNKISTVASTSAFSEDNFFSAIETCQTNGFEAVNPIMFVSPSLHTAMTKQLDGQWRSEAREGLGGMNIKVLDTAIGMIDVIPTRYLASKYGILVDPDKLELHVQAGNEVQLKEYSRTGNFTPYAMYGVYGLIVYGAANAHYLFKFS